jgi:LuxR family maltose regulon positive regulatory protein
VNARVTGMQALTSLREGDLAAAARWAASYDDVLADYFSVFERWSASLLKARIDIAQGQLVPALALLAQVRRDAEAAGIILHAVEARALQAVAYRAQGKFDAALEALGGALQLAESHGYVRVLLDEGPPMRALLREAAKRGIAPEFVAQLLVAFDEAGDDGPRSMDDAQSIRAPEPTTLGPTVLAPIEPLTEREIEVLRLIAAGLTNREVAEALYLSTNTVKSHLKHIYGKLDVHSRAHAVHRARELAIL